MTRRFRLLVLTILLCHRAADAQDFAFDFECPNEVLGAPGSTVQVTGFATLSSSDQGITSWTCGFETRSPDGLEFCIDPSLEQFTPDDRRDLLDSQGEPARILTFLPNSLLFGIQNAEDTCDNLTGDVNNAQNGGRRGIIDAVTFSFGNRLLAHDGLRMFPFTIDCVVPSDPAGQTLELEYVGELTGPVAEALQGPGQPVFNVVSFQETSPPAISFPVTLPAAKTIRIRPLQPADCDVLYNLADPALAGPEWSVNALDNLCADAGSCSLSLTLQDLPPHSSLELHFDLSTLSDWQGGSELGAHDRFQVTTGDGTTLVDTTFSTDPVKQQLYPGSWPSGTLQDAGSGSFVTSTDLSPAGYGYAFRLSFPHTDDTLTVQFDSTSSSGTPGVFALENVLVRSPEFDVRGFVVGDANADGILGVADPLAMLFHMFAGRSLPCLAAADFAVDSQLDIQDPVSLLQALFVLLGPTESLNCERRQPTESTLSCDHYQPCPLDDVRSSGIGTLADTGQEECFHVDGASSPCCATFNAGQDGFFSTGCSSEDRFVDNADGTVTDTCTGLQWQRFGADVDGSDIFDPLDDRTNWSGALSYCATLDLAGHDDWRLPNVRELESLFDHGNTDAMVPSIDPVFQAEAALYCSSTSRASDPAFAYAVHFGASASDPIIVRMDASKSAADFFVRAVRDAPGAQTLAATGQSTCYTDTGAAIACGDASFPGQDGEHGAACGPGGRFTDNGDGTITDACTGLQWQQAVGDPVTWTLALSYCATLELATHDDWRLPNVRELESLVDYAASSGAVPTLDASFQGPADRYFSSTTGGADPSHACTLNFALEPAAAGAGVVSMDASKNSAQHFVRAVRTAE